MKRSFLILVALLSIGLSGHTAAAEVSLSINIGPPVVIGAPSAMVMVPGTRVYFAPGFDVDIFFYGGYWWSPRGDRWYRAGDYDGPWRMVSRSSVPRAVYRVPKEYRAMYGKERHIPYGQWKKERGGYGHGGGRGHGRGHD
ncbi:hypothetical protein KP004_10200 [Geomonas oryzisoli]|uniref:DUF3300 domain-containing protein n=1 Tax=Geomonas oryzisoli TaxID=2847992 RepID=A0ABX8JAN9_9BACT|nr:hypothetical protein [Geomonas oryzisoli]QWV95513.1 hypothetical protein KP004_10200 [Geomonas oryzisoli]